MERMNSLDAVFVAVEDSVNHMHIGSVGVFEGPTPPFADVRALVASKLQLIPRYRQRVREAPMSIGRPLWIDDVHFDLDYHLRATGLPADADRRGLEQLVGRVMSQPLDRNRPLWEMWVIDGLSDDRWAILSKVHHCMVDGIAGTDLLGVIMDTEPYARPAPADDWTPAGEPSRIDLGQATVRMALESVAGVASGVAGMTRHPARAWDRFRNIAVGLERLAAPSRRAGASLTGPIGPHRRWTRTRASMDDIRTVRHAFGGTFNDVVLAAVTGGFRELLLSRGRVARPSEHHDAHPGVDAVGECAPCPRQPGVGRVRAAPGRHRRPGRAPQRDPRAHGRAEAITRDRRFRRGRGDR